MKELNKLVAEFMGIEVYEGFNEHTNNKYYYYNNSIFQDYEGLPEYNSDWNALMPVIEYIEDLFQKGTGQLCKVYISCNNDPKDKYYYCSIYGSADHHFYAQSKDSKISSIFNALIEFIEWYNIDNE